MNEANALAIHRELQRRGIDDVPIRLLSRRLFDKQFAFASSKAKRKAAICSRRSGKTKLVVRYALLEAVRTKAIVQIWGITRLRAKQLFWEDLKKVADSCCVVGRPNETELTYKISGGGEVRILGADKQKETEKQRGDALALAIIDEAQLFVGYLKNLVENIITPSLIDLSGTVCIFGTPDPVCEGYWYEATRPEARLHGFELHHWTLFDNPYLPHARQEIERLKRDRNWTDDNPTYMREILGKWVQDISTKFYKYDRSINGYESLPAGHRWRKILGWDLGSDDAMALVAWAYSTELRGLWEWKSWKKNGASLAEVMSQIDSWEEIDGPFDAMVADTGGGGKMVVEDVRLRYNKHFEAAQKTEKFHHVTMLNDDFAAGLLHVRVGSPYETELGLLVKNALDPTKEDERCENHCCDAGLYAWRKTRHYWNRPNEPQPTLSTDAALEQALIRMEEKEIDDERYY